MKTNSLIQLAPKAYVLLIKITSSLQSPVLLVIRLYWGWSFFQTGKGKLSDLSKVTAFFTDLGIPFPSFNALLAGTTECVGGLLLLVGLASRLTAIPLITTMVVAYITADSEALKSIFSDPDKFLGADPFLFLFASVLVLAFGPGAFSLDYLIGRKLAAPKTDATTETPVDSRHRVVV
jgi:putative oxidoreductase